jgi:hypothetical protein
VLFYSRQKSSDSVVVTVGTLKKLTSQLLVFQTLYLGESRLIRPYCFGLIFLVFATLYTYTYFSQTVIVEDESCDSSFQFVIKHIVDGF